MRNPYFQTATQARSLNRNRRSIDTPKILFRALAEEAPTSIYFHSSWHHSLYLTEDFVRHYQQIMEEHPEFKASIDWWIRERFDGGDYSAMPQTKPRHL